MNLTHPGRRDRVDIAAARLGAMATSDEPIGPLTTYRVGGAASLFARPKSFDDLELIADVLAETGLPCIVIGRGSNMLVADAGFCGIAISLLGLAADLDVIRETGDAGVTSVHVRAGGALALPLLARRTVAAGLTGLEWAVGVPGTVGGGIKMNAGGHGSDVATSLADVDLYDLRRRERATLRPESLGLRFRGSDVADHQIVISARFRMANGDVATSTEELEEIVRWRREKQPGGQNAGSVFVNPVPGEIPSGVLIDGLGLRGFRIGTAHVSDKHANFIQGTDGGTAADVRAVIETVRARVAEETGFLLRSEVKLIGFDDAPLDDAVGVRWDPVVPDGEHRMEDS